MAPPAHESTRSGMRALGGVAFAGIAGAVWLLSLSALAGREFAESVPSDTAELLTSGRAEEVARGERLVAEYRSYYVKVLLGRIRTGNVETQGEAAADLGVIISPWRRGAGARFYSAAVFPAPRRPVEKVPQVPEAAEIRRVLQGAVVALLNTPAGGYGEILQRTVWIHTFCATLAEVADDATMDWAMERLTQTESVDLAEVWLAFGESYMGIPRLFHRGGICGNVGREGAERFHQAQEAALAEAKRTLRAKWAEVRPMRAEERIAFAIRSWRENSIAQQWFRAGYYSETGWLFQAMERLVRFGAPAVAALRAQQALETELEAKGVWEAVIATITGRENPELMRALFAGSDAQRELACEIAVCAGSREWLSQLDELQYRGGFNSGKASDAIAICHGEAGIPALRRAFTRNARNFHAKSAVEKLGAGAAFRSPDGVSR